MRRVPAWLVVVAAVGAGAFIGWLLRPSDSSRSVAVVGVDAGEPANALGRFYAPDSWEARPRPAGKVLKGRVLEDGQRAAGARVALGRAELVTSDDGRFSFPAEVLDGGTALFIAQKGGRFSEPFVVGPDDIPLDDVPVPLFPASTVRGRVVDVSTRKGLPRASVKLERQPEVVTVADEQGRFALPPVPPGSGRLVISVPGYLAFSEPLRLRAGEALELELPLQRAFTLRGRVVGPSGKPVPNAQVVARALGRDAELGRVRASASGTFELSGLPRRALRLVVEAPLHAATLVLVPEGASQVTVRLPAGGDIEGVVLDERGPLARAQVLAAAGWAMPPAGRPLVTAEADERGRFRLSALLPGRYEVVAESAGVAPSEPAYIDVAPGKLASIELRLSRAKGLLRGTVVDAKTKAPVGKARVAVSQERHGRRVGAKVETGPDGRFFVSNAGSGEWLVEVSATGYAPESDRAVADGPERTIPLQRAYFAEGRVVDDDGTPVREFTVGDVALRAMDGRFRVAPADGATALTFNADDRVELHVRIDQRAGHVFDMGDVPMPRGLPVRIHVVDEAGQPVAAAMVYGIWRADLHLNALVRLGEAHFVGIADAQGRAVAYVAPGRYCFAAQAPSGPSGTPKECPITVAEGGAEVTLTVRKPAWVRGVVTRNGSPYAGAVVWDDAEAVFAVSGADGRFVLGPLTGGTHAVFAALTAGEQPASGFVKRLTVKPGEEATVSLEPPGAGALEGELVGPDGPYVVAAVPGELKEEKQLQAAKELRSLMVEVKNGFGAFRLDALPPGPVTVLVKAAGKASPIRLYPAQVTSGTTTRIGMRLEGARQ